MTNQTDIKDFTHERLISWLRDREIASYRAAQILKWVYLRQAEDFEGMSDLGKALRELLSSHFAIPRLEKIALQRSADGTRKYLFRLRDGNLVESVLIPERDHHTLCISSQVGCAQGCRFCLTGKGGFIRNLTQGEIISQVRDVKQELGGSARLSNIVFMGMGEPLANYENVANAVTLIGNGGHGLAFSHRKMTVSTAGIVPRIPELGWQTKVGLAISLNAADNPTRDMLMPINRKHPLEKLMAACRRYPLAPRERITFEYVLIKGINDSPDHARRLARLLRPVRAKINLIPLNEHDRSDFRRPEESVIQEFREILVRHHYTAIIRHSKGQDISAACGQLRAHGETKIFQKT